MAYFSNHNHSHYSNLRLKDAISRPKELIEYASEIGLQGVSLSDHESLSGHIKFLQAYEQLKNEDKLDSSFKVALGNEIYLVKEDSVDELKENYKNKNPDTQFFHFLLTAIDNEGHRQLRQLSSKAWENSFNTGFMTRVPTFKEDMKEIIRGGHVAATSACLGGYIPQMILRWLQAEETGDNEKVLYYKKELHEFITYCLNVFGKDKFFFEIQPSEDPEQHLVNRELIKLSVAYGIDYVVATDAHYTKKEDRYAHKVYLQSSEGEREVDAFYSSTYIFSEDEIVESMRSHLTEEEIQTALNNTMKIHAMVQEYDLFQETIIPPATIEEFELNHLFKPAYDQYDYIKKFANSEYEIDRYYLYLIEEGFKEQIQSPELTKEYFHTVMDRINTEMKELWLISERLGDRLSKYYVLTREIVDTMWNKAESLVGVARGSAAGYLTSMLLGITQINPLDYDLPHFRHLTAERPELPDIDLDSQENKRGAILQALKDTYGEDKVLNIATFSREGARSALLSAARGMGIDVDQASYLTSLIPVERGQTWSLTESFYGDGKEKRPITELINAVNQYDGLMDVALKIENLIKNNSVHASGVFVYKSTLTEHNAMMRSSSGQPTTQFDMDDSEEYLGNLKVDLLTVSNMDKIRAAMDMLIEDGYMNWQGSLRETYDKYLHPQNLAYEDSEMWRKIQDNEIPDIFQFDTETGLQTAQKTKPWNVKELGAANNLMRLMPDSGMSPVDRYVLHKQNPETWIKEMEEYGLSKEEMGVMRYHVGEKMGVSDSQEDIMLLSMDESISGFTIPESNKLRKSVAKKKPEVLQEVKNLFYEKGGQQDTSSNMLDYVWNTQIMPQAGYGFSQLHSSSYSLIALQNMNLAHNYPAVYWSTACLSVNSGADESIDSNKTTEYGRIAAAIGDMQQRGTTVALPSINRASYGFKPDPKNNRILFGLRAINSIGDDTAHTIINNRPYTSFKDFLNRLYDTKLIKNTHILQLIKAGCFDEFDTRTDIMEQYINHTFAPRKNLTLASFNTVIELNLVPDELAIYIRYFYFRKHIYKNKVGTSSERKTKNRLFKLDQISAEFLHEHFSEDCIVDYSEDGLPIIVEYLFDNQYQKKMQVVKDWLAKEDTLKMVNDKQWHIEWDKAGGNNPISQNEMSSLSYYYTAHELDHVDRERYDISNYNDIPEDPVVTNEFEWKGRTRYEYQTYRIAGTVLDKNKDRHTVTILTTNGVVVVKLYSGIYSHFDRQISKRNPDGTKTVVEAPWFKRGTLIMFSGFRRGNQFVPRRYRNSIHQKTVVKIDDVDEDGNLSLTTERAETD